MIKKFFSHVMPGVMKPLRVVWNQVIGFLFLMFAVLSFRSVYKSYTEFNGGGQSIFQLTISVLFVLIMSFFGITSFLRARKISRS
jgi:hypothetical protein